jgi:type I restriction enzyme, S subunit
MKGSSRLGDVLLGIQAGKSFQTAEVLARPDEFGVLKVSAVTWTKFQADEAKALAGQYVPAESHKVRKGDFLISRANTKEFVGAVVLVDRDYPLRLLSDKTLRLVIDENNADKEFLLYALRAPNARNHIEHFATGTSDSMRNIAQGVIAAIPISLPTLNRQRQIAIRLKAQLAEVETARQVALVQLSDTRLLRTRLLKQFFAELDAAPRKRLGDHAPTTSGSTPSRGNKLYWEPAEIAWVKTGEVAFAPITATEEAISKKALTECSLSLLPPKTILIAMYGQGKTRGQSAILEVPATTNQACFAILPNDTWEPDFLYLWLKSSYQDLRDLSDDRGGNQANLNGALLKALDVPAPSKPDQERIVKRIQAAMTEIDALENASQAALEDIHRLPNRVLAQAFDQQGDHHD